MVCAPRTFRVPRPANFGETSHPSSQSKKAVPEEYAPFDAVSEAIEDAAAALLHYQLRIHSSQNVITYENAAIHHSTGQDRQKAD